MLCVGSVTEGRGRGAASGLGLEGRHTWGGVWGMHGIRVASGLGLEGREVVQHADSDAGWRLGRCNVGLNR